MTEKKRNIYYWLCRVASVIISCALPIWAICEKFPIWKTTYGSAHSVGLGGILILVVLLIIFRRAVFGFIKDKFKLNNTPPLIVWLAMLIVSYVLLYISRIVYDMTIVFWMGFIGCAIGTLITFIAENYFGKKESE